MTRYDPDRDLTGAGCALVILSTVVTLAIIVIVVALTMPTILQRFVP